MRGLLVPVIVESIRTRKDGTLAVTVGCQEMSPAKSGELFTYQNKISTMYLCQAEVQQKDITQIDALEPEVKGKRPSERMRNVLWLMWKQDPEGYKDSEMYYRFKMEKFIDELKNNLTPTE